MRVCDVDDFWRGQVVAKLKDHLWKPLNGNFEAFDSWFLALLKGKDDKAVAMLVEEFQCSHNREWNQEGDPWVKLPLNDEMRQIAAASMEAACMKYNPPRLDRIAQLREQFLKAEWPDGIWLQQAQNVVSLQIIWGLD